MIKQIRESKYFLMTACLFLAFLGHGMGGMIISQNRVALEGQWGNLYYFGSVMSMVGWGRLLTFFIAGKLSDSLGRKFFIALGTGVYIVGLIGMSFSDTLFFASSMAFLFGAANSFLDVGTYPALVEAFPAMGKKMNTALVINIRIAQLILPIVMLSVFSATGLGMNFRISFFAIAAIFVLNFILVMASKFPDHKAALAEQKAQIEADKAKNPETKAGVSALFTIEGMAFIVYGFISMGTFMIIQQFSNRFGAAVLGMDPDIANFIPTFFAVGSIIGVLITIFSLNKFKAVDVMVALTATSLAATLIVRFAPSVPTLIIGTALIGFAAAGGVMQMGITLMIEIMPLGKGVVSGTFLSMGSIASIVVPQVVASIEANNHLNVMLFNAGLAAVGLLCAIIINVRFKAIEKAKASQ